MCKRKFEYTYFSRLFVVLFVLNRDGDIEASSRSTVPS